MEVDDATGLCGRHAPVDPPDASSQNYFSLLLQESGLETAAYPFGNQAAVDNTYRGYICELDGTTTASERQQDFFLIHPSS